MAWIDIASKLVTEPVTLVSIAWSSGTLGYSDTWVRTSSTLYKGNIMDLPQVKSSIGDLLRTHERNKITLIFADTDYEMRAKLEDESPNLKNIVVTITSAFVDDAFSDTEVLFTGQISDWKMKDELLFEMEIEELSIDLENEFPDQIVNLTDYANADGESLDWSIPIPYGVISALGSSGDGAYGHPSLTDGSGLPFVDTTVDSEVHLVGMQAYIELITNGNFTSDINNWDVLSTATLANVGGGKSGNCIRITGNGASHPGAKSKNFTVVPGSWYYTECYAKLGTENEYILQIRDRTNAAYIYDSGHVEETEGDWTTKVYKVWQAPAGCFEASVYIRSASNGGEAKTFFFDSVKTSEIIGVDRVYMDKRDGNGAVLQTEGTGAGKYLITTQVIGGKTHVLISWGAGINPLPEYRISCDVTFGSRRSVAGIKHFLENHSSYSSFDAVALAAAEAKELSRGYDFAGVIWEPQDLASLLDYWRDQWELDIFWNKAGEVTFKYMSSELGSNLTEYNDLNDILEGFTADPDVKKLLNYADFAHTFHWSKTYHLTHSVYQDTDSQTKYAITIREFIGLRWTRLASVASDIASRKIIRRKDPMTLISLRLPLKSFKDDLADFVRITHSFGSGSAGYVDKFCQIRSVDYDLDEYVNNMLLEDASNFAGNAFILGDGDILPATWNDAVGGERDYGYLCDGTDGFFSNDVDSGKRLFD